MSCLSDHSDDSSTLLLQKITSHAANARSGSSVVARGRSICICGAQTGGSFGFLDQHFQPSQHCSSRPYEFEYSMRTTPCHNIGLWMWRRCCFWRSVRGCEGNGPERSHQPKHFPHSQRRGDKHESTYRQHWNQSGCLFKIPWMTLLSGADRTI